MQIRLMKIETLAQYIDASPNKVREMIKKRQLPPARYNEPHFVRWDRNQVDAWLDHANNLKAGQNFHPDSFEAHLQKLKERLGT